MNNISLLSFEYLSRNVLVESSLNKRVILNRTMARETVVHYDVQSQAPGRDGLKSFVC